ncbi:hypothetical protein NDU88_005227 [Pleurodeles waltl]|uniref:Uncharacterized protein n=1 Tax=Pleurodeles waltl TaxID=8319 RepID=A0AAV7QE34_PLEWA|nr:hypothetical protein NDU88_005227 [Pleurodeles waltl]
MQCNVGPPQQGLTTRGPDQGRLPVSHRKWSVSGLYPTGAPHRKRSTGRKSTAWCRARPSPGPQLHGPRPDKTAEDPPSQRCSSPLSMGPQGEPFTSPQQPRGILAAPCAPLRLRPSRTPAGPQHFTDSPGSKPVDSRTGRGPVRSQMPPVGGSTYSTPESG